MSACPPAPRVLSPLHGWAVSAPQRARGGPGVLPGPVLVPEHLGSPGGWGTREDTGHPGELKFQITADWFLGSGSVPNTACVRCVSCRSGLQAPAPTVEGPRGNSHSFGVPCVADSGGPSTGPRGSVLGVSQGSRRDTGRPEAPGPGSPLRTPLTSVDPCPALRM